MIAAQAWPQWPGCPLPRAQLDALFFFLYEINEDDSSYILDTFTIVKWQDESEFGSYRTKEMILAYMRALKAGDTKTKVHVN